jgi:TPR repeat protein
MMHEFLCLRGDAAEEVGDYAVAHTCFTAAAEAGDDIGWCRLGLLYDQGHGVRPDKDRAMQCYREAWRKRNCTAAWNIAVLYREQGRARLAFRWFLRAAETGDGDAWLEVARGYRDGIGVRKSPQRRLQALARCLAADTTTEGAWEEADAEMDLLRPRLVATERPSAGRRSAPEPGHGL